MPVNYRSAKLRSREHLQCSLLKCETRFLSVGVLKFPLRRDIAFTPVMDDEEGTTVRRKGIILSKGLDGCDDSNGDREQLSSSEDEIRKQEDDGLTMRVLKFMGLPKSYRQSLYEDLVEEAGVISSIPSETANSFLGLVTWACGKKDQRSVDIGQASAQITGDAELNTINDIKACIILAQQSSTNIEIETPFQMPLISTKGNTRDINNNRVVCPKAACLSETALYAYGVLEEDSDFQEVDENSKMSALCFKEIVQSETNIYACQCEYDDEIFRPDLKSYTKPIPYEGGEGPSMFQEPLATIQSELTQENTRRNKFEPLETSEEPDNGRNFEDENSAEKRDPGFVGNVASPPLLAALNPPTKEISSLPTSHSDNDVNKKIRVKDLHQNLPKVASATRTTSEIQLQLNEDLKTLEEIVKKLYKSLNKKGPVTIVANFKPKADGELAMELNNNSGKLGKTENKVKVEIRSSPSTTTPLAHTETTQTEAISTTTETTLTQTEAAFAQTVASLSQTESEEASDNDNETRHENEGSGREVEEIEQEKVIHKPMGIMKNSSCLPLHSTTSLVRKPSVSFASKPVQLTTPITSFKATAIRGPVNTSFTCANNYDQCAPPILKRKVSANLALDRNNNITRRRDLETDGSKSNQFSYKHSYLRSPALPIKHTPCLHHPQANHVTFTANRGCQFQHGLVKNMRIIRKCISHDDNQSQPNGTYPTPSTVQPPLQESTSDASTSSSTVSTLLSGYDNEDSSGTSSTATNALQNYHNESPSSMPIKKVTSSTGQKIRTKVYIPSAPASQRKTSYTEMFREKLNQQQQQAQTFYVNLTRGRNGNANGNMQMQRRQSCHHVSFSSFDN